LGVWGVRMVDGVPHIRPPRAVDPLQRWVINPRRALQEQTARQLTLAMPASGGGPGARSGPGGFAQPHDRVEPDDPPEVDCPDIPSRHGTCQC
ncbi:hypothetical protein, partial [Quadrisphaera granulorum]|uniref:hypothetical protein n=1 Tax=Quadrisphaera granulorum TaxID=317664 RepID=UPI001B86E0F4